MAALRKRTSCGCDYLHPASDITGKKYGKLTVEYRIIESNIETFAMKWKCRCDCGKEITATTLALQAGLIVSCGCTAADEVTLDLANINTVIDFFTYFCYNIFNVLIYNNLWKNYCSKNF